jgi:hypothetical protein
VNYETDIIHELAKGKNIPTPTQSQKEVRNAIEIIRKGKAADIFNIAIEHFLCSYNAISGRYILLNFCLHFFLN